MDNESRKWVPLPNQEELIRNVTPREREPMAYIKTKNGEMIRIPVSKIDEFRRREEQEARAKTTGEDGI